MTIYGRSEELVSRCVECDLAEPESLTSLGGCAPGVVDGILSSATWRVLILQTGPQETVDPNQLLLLPYKIGLTIPF